jgi:large subunit ribosomal protein L13
MEHTIDAKGKKLGRIASEVAVILMGKDSVDFVKNVVADVKVKVINSSKIEMGGNKMEEVRYKSYSGYPGGLKIKSAADIIKKKGYSELVRIAVKGMLPNNKLRPVMLKNLEVTE